MKARINSASRNHSPKATRMSRVGEVSDLDDRKGAERCY